MPKPTLTFGHLKITDHLILGTAIARSQNGAGPFQHFDLQAKAYRGWNPLAEDLKAGNIDGAFILAPLAMELYHGNTPIKMLLQAHKAGSIVIKNARANINSLADFKGKNVLIPHYLSVHHMLFDRMLRESGLDIGPGKDVVFDVVAPADIPEIIEWDERGSVGGFIVAEPFGSQVVKAGYGEEFALSKDVWPDHPCCVVVVQDNLLEQYPDALHELTAALVKSGRYIEENPDKAAAIGAGFLSQDQEVVKKVLTEPEDRVTYDRLYPTLEDLEKMQNYLTGTIQAMSGKIDLEKFVDLSFAQAAGAK